MNSNKIIHDIRNPLNTIAMNAELGKLSLQKTGDVNKALAIFDTILRECQLCSERLTLLRECISDDPSQPEPQQPLSARGNSTNYE